MEAERFQLNENKCKELRICFSKLSDLLEPIIINRKQIEIIYLVKLGLNISADLKRNENVKVVCGKAATCLYFLRQLKRAYVPSKHLLWFYMTCIHSVIESACEIFLNSLPQYLPDDLERLQKRALHIIFPELSYKQLAVKYATQRNAICAIYADVNL